MWRSASLQLLRRPRPRQRAVALFTTASGPTTSAYASEVTSTLNNNNNNNNKNNRCFIAAAAARVRPHQCSFVPFSTTAGPGGGSRNDDKNKVSIDDDDDDDEGWVPPIRGQPNNTGDGDTTAASASSSSSTTSPPSSKRIDTILEVSRQVKDQDRLDKALEKTELEAEALFQLSEQEQATMTDEEILERLDEVLKREEELETRAFQSELEREENREKEQLQQRRKAEPLVGTDWLRNRRTMLGQNEEGEGSFPTSKNNKTSVIVPVIHQTMLTSDEIRLLLKAHGGRDIKVVTDDPDAPRMGGADGMIFCTGGGSSSSSSSSNDGNGNGNGNGNGSNNEEISNYINNSPYLISTLTRVLIDHMKDRKLHEIGIAPGAQQNTTNRAGTAASPASMSMYNTGQTSESWRIVDCGNYIVHVLDGMTRRDLKLEDLWSGKDPLWKLNVFDEDMVEEYCQRHPVPERYDGTGSSERHLGSYGDSSDTYVDSAAMKRLERNQFGSTRRHKPVVAQSTKNRDRRAGNKQRRAQREKEYFGASSFD